MYPSEKAEFPHEAEKPRIIPSVQVALMHKNQDGDIEFFLLHRITGGFTNYWSFPGGKIDPGETENQAACRETLEESGVIIKSEDLTFIRDTQVSTIRTIDNQSIEYRYPIKFFAVFIKDKTLAANASPNEHDEGRWFNSKEILDNNYFSQTNNGRVSLKPIISTTTQDSINIALTCQSTINIADL